MSSSGERENMAPVDAVMGDSLSLSFSGEASWYAVWTVSRHEKVANAALLEKGLETFLPLIKVLSQWKDRRKIAERPLFPGYFFVHTTMESRLTILKARGVARIVGINNTPVPIPEQEIENIRILLNSEVKSNPHPFLKVGQRVRVRTGALQGCEGILLRKKNISTLVLSIQLLQQAVSVEIDALNVEPIS